jgi:nucleoside phosphorylase
MPRLAAFAALDWECRAVLHGLSGVRPLAGLPTPAWRGQGALGEVWVVQTGVGLRHAATAAAAVDLSGCEVVISTGCAGGLAPTLLPGELVIASSVDAADGSHVTDAATCQRLLDLAAARALRVCLGPIHCSGVMIGSREEKRTAAAKGALVVEMEAAPIAAAARRAGRPFVSIRAVIDGADDDLTVLTGLVDPDSGRVRTGALVRQLIVRPRTIAELWLLRRAQVAARDALRRFFACWFAEPQP